MFAQLSKIGAILGSGISTSCASFLANASSATGSGEQIALSVMGGGIGAALAWACVKHLIETTKAQAEEIKRLNKIINEEHDNAKK